MCHVRGFVLDCTAAMKGDLTVCSTNRSVDEVRAARILNQTSGRFRVTGNIGRNIGPHWGRFEDIGNIGSIIGNKFNS